jgi:hypothetical protein
MTAGSSSDTGKNPKRFVIRITQQPIVEIDTEATAADIRLRDTEGSRNKTLWLRKRSGDAGF